MAPEVETHLVNAVLTNGARYYVDHAHPECSTPECADARSVVVCDKAAELILQRSMAAAVVAPARGPGDRRLQEQLRRQGQQLRLPRELPHGPRRCPSAGSWPTSCRTSSPARSSPGAGKVGTEVVGAHVRRRAVPAHPAGRLLRGGGRPRDHAQAADRQHPRRAPRRRPEVPAAPRDRRRRQPVRGRDVPQGRHHGARAGDDRGRLPAPRPHAGGAGGRRCARCPTTCRCASRSSSPTARRSPRSRCSGSTSTGPRSTPRSTASSAVGATEVGDEVLRRGSRCSPASRPTRCRCRRQLDWVAKYRVVDGYRERHGLRWDDARLAAMDLQYHDLRPEQVAGRPGGPASGSPPTTRSRRAVTEPPADTRAYFRGKCLQRWASRSWPPTGTRWCSTSAATRCGGCR